MMESDGSAEQLGSAAIKIDAKSRLISRYFRGIFELA
jgi:hypothetical protein